jgi:glucose-6-phosphate-specific signal transduction histidine kinase
MAVWKPQQHVVFYTILLGAITLAADYATGPYIRFPVLFLLPIILASWYHGWPLGVGVAALLPTLRLSLSWHWDETTPWTMTEPIVNGCPSQTDACNPESPGLSQGFPG